MDDLHEFKQAFLDESFECIDVLERTLLSEDENIDVDTIFRQIHSLKGGTAVFGFSEVENALHTLENYLDKIRSGDAHFTESAVTHLLSIIDSLRLILHDIKEDKEPSSELLDQQVTHLIEQKPTDFESSNEESTEGVVLLGQQTEKKLQLEHLIRLKQLPEINEAKLREGFQILDGLGMCMVQVEEDCIIDFEDVSFGMQAFTWHVNLITKQTQDQIIEQLAPFFEVELIQEEKPEAGSIGVTSQESRKKVDDAVRISIKKIDHLINLIGEVGVEFSSINAEIKKSGFVTEEKLQKVKRRSDELQGLALSLRTIPIKNYVSRFSRIIRETGSKLGKKIKLVTKGMDTEIDKVIMDKMSEPILHIIRNAIDHGLEDSNTRISQGKAEQGTIEVRAQYEGGKVVLTISDDGSGIDPINILNKAVERGVVSRDVHLEVEDIYQLIFYPGFTTKDAASSLSGRGVGLDIVRENLIQIGGDIIVSSNVGKGSVFTIKVPLNVSVFDGQVFSVRDGKYILPLVNLLEAKEYSTRYITRSTDNDQLYNLRGEFIPLIFAEEVLFQDGLINADKNQYVLFTNHNDKTFGLVVHDLLTTEQVVMKDIGNHMDVGECIAGASILPNGQVSFVIDRCGLLNSHKRMHKEGTSAAVGRVGG